MHAAPLAPRALTLRRRCRCACEFESLISHRAAGGGPATAPLLSRPRALSTARRNEVEDVDAVKRAFGTQRMARAKVWVKNEFRAHLHKLDGGPTAPPAPPPQATALDNNGALMLLGRAPVEHMYWVIMRTTCMTEAQEIHHAQVMTLAVDAVARKAAAALTTDEDKLLYLPERFRTLMVWTFYCFVNKTIKDSGTPSTSAVEAASSNRVCQRKKQVSAARGELVARMRRGTCAYVRSTSTASHGVPLPHPVAARCRAPARC